MPIAQSLSFDFVFASMHKSAWSFLRIIPSSKLDVHTQYSIKPLENEPEEH